MNHKRVRRYTFIIGNRLTRRLVVARIDPEVLLVRQRPRESEILCKLMQLLYQ